MTMSLLLRNGDDDEGVGSPVMPLSRSVVVFVENGSKRSKRTGIPGPSGNFCKKDG